MVRSTILFNKRITPSELAAIARANAISRTAKKSPLSPKSQVPKIKLNNGQEMPAMGLGTWQVIFISVYSFGRVQFSYSERDN